MGNREALLAGAIQCLREKGYARTTARDVARTANVSLAAIGYHFGTIQQLMTVALIEATREWSDLLGRELADAQRRSGSEKDPLKRFERVWRRILSLFASHRSLWAAHLEAAAQPDRSPELAEFLSQSQEQARLGMAELFHGSTLKDRETALSVGTFYQAMLSGVMTQMLVDPSSAPSAEQLASAVRTIVEDFGGTAPGRKPSR